MVERKNRIAEYILFFLYSYRQKMSLSRLIDNKYT